LLELVVLLLALLVCANATAARLRLPRACPLLTPEQGDWRRWRSWSRLICYARQSNGARGAFKLAHSAAGAVICAWRGLGPA